MYNTTFHTTHRNIEDVHTDTTHVLLSADTLLGRPLEGSNTRILDFVQVLNTLGDINNHVGTSGVGTETPDLPRVRNIPSELVGKDTRTKLEIVTSADLTTLDGLGQFFVDGQGLDVETIVLVL